MFRKIEKCPETAEPELYHEPGDDVELLHGVDEVHHQKHKAHPEGRHRHKHEPLPNSLFLVVGGGAHHANEAQNIYKLK